MIIEKENERVFFVWFSNLDNGNFFKEQDSLFIKISDDAAFNCDTNEMKAGFSSAAVIPLKGKIVITDPLSALECK